MPNLVEIGSVVLEKEAFKDLSMFCYFVINEILLVHHYLPFYVKKEIIMFLKDVPCVAIVEEGYTCKYTA